MVSVKVSKHSSWNANLCTLTIFYSLKRKFQIRPEWNRVINTVCSWYLQELGSSKNQQIPNLWLPNQESIELQGKIVQISSEWYRQLRTASGIARGMQDTPGDAWRGKWLKWVKMVKSQILGMISLCHISINWCVIYSRLQWNKPCWNISFLSKVIINKAMEVRAIALHHTRGPWCCPMAVWDEVYHGGNMQASCTSWCKT